MKKLFFIALGAVLALAVSLVGYGAYLNMSGESRIAERMAGRAIPLDGARAQRRSLTPQIRLSTANFSPVGMADAIALVDGQIAKCYVQKNQPVKAGDLLFSLVNPSIPLQLREADSGILKAQAELVRAQNSYQRYERLIKMDATSREKYDEAIAYYEAAKASLAEAEARKEQLLVQEARQRVAAPIDGEVLLLYRQPGTYVSVGTALALIGDFHELYFSLTLSDLEVQRLTERTQDIDLSFRRAAAEKVYDTEYGSSRLGAMQAFPLRIDEITPPIGTPAERRKVKFAIENKGRLLEPQTYSDITITSKSRVEVLAVPESAMLDDSHQAVFVLTDFNDDGSMAYEGKLARRNVKTGASDGQYIEIIDGLKVGDVVVTADPEGLKEGMTARITVREAQ